MEKGRVEEGKEDWEQRSEEQRKENRGEGVEGQVGWVDKSVV